MEGQVDLEGTREFETNTSGVNDALNLIWANELVGGLPGMDLERDVLSREPNVLTRLAVQGRSLGVVSQAPVAVRDVAERHPSVHPDLLALVLVGLD